MTRPQIKSYIDANLTSNPAFTNSVEKLKNLLKYIVDACLDATAPSYDYTFSTSTVTVGTGNKVFVVDNIGLYKVDNVVKVFSTTNSTYLIGNIVNINTATKSIVVSITEVFNTANSTSLAAWQFGILFNSYTQIAKLKAAANAPVILAGPATYIMLDYYNANPKAREFIINRPSPTGDFIITVIGSTYSGVAVNEIYTISNVSAAGNITVQFPTTPAGWASNTVTISPIGSISMDPATKAGHIRFISTGTAIYLLN